MPSALNRSPVAALGCASSPTADVSGVSEALRPNRVYVFAEGFDRVDAEARLDVAGDLYFRKAETASQRGVEGLQDVTSENGVELAERDALYGRTGGYAARSGRLHALHRAKLLRADEQPKICSLLYGGSDSRFKIHVGRLDR